MESLRGAVKTATEIAVVGFVICIIIAIISSSSYEAENSNRVVTATVLELDGTVNDYDVSYYETRGWFGGVTYIETEEGKHFEVSTKNVKITSQDK